MGRPPRPDPRGAAAATTFGERGRSGFLSLVLVGAALASGCSGGDDSDAPHRHGTGAAWPGEASEDIRRFLESLPRAPGTETASALQGASLPASFDARSAFVGPDGASLIMGALDQGDTENCWVYSPVSVSADRLRIAYAAQSLSNELFDTVDYDSWDPSAGSFTGAPVQVLNFPDPVQIAECCGQICSDVSPGSACATQGVAEWTYTVLSTTGAPTFESQPLQQCGGSCPSIPAGAAIVRTGTPYIVVQWDERWSSASPTTIQSEVMAHGPVTTYMQIADEFRGWFDSVSYPGGAITAAQVFDTSDTGGNTYSSRDSSLGGHFVAILGWGTTTDDPPVDYWIVRNSWGQTHGDHGVFLMQRGANFCMIEQYAQAVPTTVPD
jgi:hypothetical protein